MARPKADYPSAEAILALADEDGRLALRATPASRSEGISIDANGLQLKVRAKPEDGKANAAILALLAKALGCAPSRIELLRGTTSREKLILIRDM